MKQHKEASEKSDIITQIGLYTASAVAGLFSIWSYIRSTFYLNVRKGGWFKDILEKRDVAFKAIEDIDGVDYVKKHLEINKNYSEDVTRVNKLKGFTNSWQKFKVLTTDQKVKVGGILVAVGAVTAGAIMNIRQNQQLARKLEAMERKNDPAATGNAR